MEKGGQKSLSLACLLPMACKDGGRNLKDWPGLAKMFH